MSRRLVRLEFTGFLEFAGPARGPFPFRSRTAEPPWSRKGPSRNCPPPACSPGLSRENGNVLAVRLCSHLSPLLQIQAIRVRRCRPDRSHRHLDIERAYSSIRRLLPGVCEPCSAAPGAAASLSPVNMFCSIVFRKDRFELLGCFARTAVLFFVSTTPAHRRQRIGPDWYRLPSNWVQHHSTSISAWSAPAALIA